MRTFKELGFKPGDTVVCTKVLAPWAKEQRHYYEVGDCFKLQEGYYVIARCGTSIRGSNGDWELVKEPIIRPATGWQTTGDRVFPTKELAVMSLINDLFESAQAAGRTVGYFTVANREYLKQLFKELE